MLFFLWEPALSFFYNLQNSVRISSIAAEQTLLQEIMAISKQHYCSILTSSHRVPDNQTLTADCGIHLRVLISILGNQQLKGWVLGHQYKKFLQRIKYSLVLFIPIWMKINSHGNLEYFILCRGSSVILFPSAMSVVFTLLLWETEQMICFWSTQSSDHFFILSR